MPHFWNSQHVNNQNVPISRKSSSLHQPSKFSFFLYVECVIEDQEKVPINESRATLILLDRATTSLREINLHRFIVYSKPFSQSKDNICFDRNHLKNTIDFYRNFKSHFPPCYYPFSILIRASITVVNNAG